MASRHCSESTVVRTPQPVSTEWQYSRTFESMPELLKSSRSNNFVGARELPPSKFNTQVKTDRCVTNAIHPRSSQRQKCNVVWTGCRATLFRSTRSYTCSTPAWLVLLDPAAAAEALLCEVFARV